MTPELGKSAAMIFVKQISVWFTSIFSFPLNVRIPTVRNGFAPVRLVIDGFTTCPRVTDNQKIGCCTNRSIAWWNAQHYPSKKYRWLSIRREGCTDYDHTNRVCCGPFAPDWWKDFLTRNIHLCKLFLLLWQKSLMATLHHLWPTKCPSQTMAPSSPRSLTQVHQPVCKRTESWSAPKRTRRPANNGELIGAPTCPLQSAIPVPKNGPIHPQYRLFYDGGPENLVKQRNSVDGCLHTILGIVITRLAIYSPK